MKERVIYDPGEPIALRKYPSEGLAEIDRALLETANIPAFIRQNRLSEVDVGAVVLVVRRGDAAAALEILDSD